MRYLKTIATVTAFAASAAALPASAAELVTNGGFETGDFTGWVQGGDTGFTGVSSLAPPGGTGPVARTGTFGAFFGPIGAIGTLSQTLATVVGQSYDVVAWFRRDGGNPNSIQASFGGNIFTNSSNLAAGAYRPIGGSFIATSTSTLLSFSFQHDPAYFYLDDVSVDGPLAPVPEPGTWAMMLVGFGAVGTAMRSRSRRRSTKVSFA